MNIALPADLADIDVNDLDDDQLRDAFVANFKKAEAIRASAQSYADACDQIIERLGRGLLVGLCADCGAPLFDSDDYVVRERDYAYACAAGGCVGDRKRPAPAPTAPVDTAAHRFKHRFAQVRK